MYVYVCIEDELYYICVCFVCVCMCMYVSKMRRTPRDTITSVRLCVCVCALVCMYMCMYLCMCMCIEQKRTSRITTASVCVLCVYVCVCMYRR
jgi:hypothetical protein